MGCGFRNGCSVGVPDVSLRFRRTNANRPADIFIDVFVTIGVSITSLANYVSNYQQRISEVRFYL